jgi:hypothetical protein
MRTLRRFYICLDNLDNVERCKGSRDNGTAITLAGVPANGGVVHMYSGIVHSIEHDPARGRNRQWLITMLD